jgi:hypothetical protein
MDRLLSAARRILIMAFAKRQPTDEIATAEQKVIDLTAQISAAKSALEAAEAAATAAALSGQGLDEAVSVAAQASAKLRAFERAKAETDDKVVALRAAKLTADNAARRAEAVTKLHQLRDEAAALRRDLLPLVNRLRELVLYHDGTSRNDFGRGTLRPLLDPINAVLLAPDIIKDDADGLATTIAQGDNGVVGLADELSGRVLNYSPQPLPPVE